MTTATHPPVAAGTALHIAGPWEDEYAADGTLWRVQRCLNCDARLVGVIYRRGEHPNGLRLGQHVALAAPCSRPKP